MLYTSVVGDESGGSRAHGVRGASGIKPSSSLCVRWEDDMIVVVMGVQKIVPLVWGVLEEHLLC